MTPVSTPVLPQTDISPTSTPSPSLTLVPVPANTPTTIPSYIADADRKLTREEAMELKETEKEYSESLAFIKDAIAPAMMRIDATKLQIGDTYIRTIFTYAYPDVLEGNWLSPLINWDVKFDISMYVYPVDSARVMKFLRKRLTQLGSQRAMNNNK